MDKKRLALLAAASIPLLAVGCKGPGKTDSGSPDTATTRGRSPQAHRDEVRVAAATYPVAWLGCQILGEPCRAQALVPPGASAHSWEPKPSDLQRLGDADFYIRCGLAFEESWLPRFRSSLPDLLVIDAAPGLDLRDEHHGRHEGHGKGLEENDPHVWSSPRAMDGLAEVVATGIAQIRPDLKPRLDRNLPATHAKLLELDTVVRGLLAPFSGKTFLVNHPGLGYLARDYGLVQKALESHGQELTPVALWDVRKTAKAQGIRAVFVQPEYSRRVADQIAKELEVETVDFDLLQERPYDSVFLARAKAMADKL